VIGELHQRTPREHPQMKRAVERGERLPFREARHRDEERIEKTRVRVLRRYPTEIAPMNSASREVTIDRLESVIRVAEACGVGGDLYMHLVTLKRPQAPMPQLRDA
jgi:hypothetical protein